MNTNVRVWTGQKVRGTENKFYRTYIVERASGGPDFSVTQWGSQRNGRSGGSFKIDIGTGLAAKKQLEKEREGYLDTKELTGLVVDYDKFRAQLMNGGDKGAGVFLDNLYAAASRGARPAAATGVTCDICHLAYKDSLALRKHKSMSHPNVSGGTPAPAPDPVPSTIDRLGVLSDKALEAIGLAATDTTRAMVLLASLREQKDVIAAELRKAESYLSTLETLVEEEVMA